MPLQLRFLPQQWFSRPTTDCHPHSEKGTLQIAIFNDGQSPAHNIIVSVLPKNPEMYIVIGEPFVIDTLEAGRIKYANIGIE